MTWRAVAVCCAAFATTPVGAIELTLDRRAIEEAIFIGRTTLDAERNRFHASYRVQVGRPPVDWIDVITPFHRVELAAEGAMRRGVRSFGQREAFEALREAPDQIDVIVEMTFHPLNTFVGVPTYQVALIAPDGRRIEPRQLDRIPRSTPRLDPTWPTLPLTSGSTVITTGQPVLGGTMIAAFNSSLLQEDRTYEAVVMNGETELTRSVLDLGLMR